LSTKSNTNQNPNKIINPLLPHRVDFHPLWANVGKMAAKVIGRISNISRERTEA